ncbi:MAG: class I SAM-dependent methyltransferase [Planctomycetota bacterium]|jgi:SAM-dependent methyltransferase
MELAKEILGPLETGVEIGASSLTPFPGVQAWNLDRYHEGVFQELQMHKTGEVASIDILGTAQVLPIRDECLDFILASHVLEHMPDTIRALREWDRAIKPSGIVFMIIPHKERNIISFDKRRPRTLLEHHLADFAVSMTENDDPLTPTSHYHVWITGDVVNLIEYLNKVGWLDWKLEKVEDEDSYRGNGFTVVARKQSRPPMPEPEHSDRIAFHQLTLTLPFQAVGYSLERILPGPELSIPEDFPRGSYQCMPVFEGFPPRAGLSYPIEVGPPMEAPEIISIEREDDNVRIIGKRLTPSTWIEGQFPDGIHRFLPDYDDGSLTIPMAGIHLPQERVQVIAVNLPPGGGPSPAFEVDPRTLA